MSASLSRKIVPRLQAVGKDLHVPIEAAQFDEPLEDLEDQRFIIDANELRLPGGRDAG